jgi:tetratricopeptide (TPR) repeat protein
LTGIGVPVPDFRKVRPLKKILTCGWAALALPMLFLDRGAAENGEGADLLTRPGAAPVYCSDVRLPLAALQALTDGNSQTARVFAGGSGVPWEIIYRLGEDASTPQRLEIQLSADSREQLRFEPWGTVQVSVTDLAERTGFQDLWSMPVAVTPRPQSVEFPERAARWIKLRFTPAPAAARLRLAEVHVFGRPGRPRSNYQFKESPAQALEVLRKLKATAGEARLSGGEAALFADAEGGKLRAFSPAEAALVASGVEDAARRDDYLKRLHALAEAARLETASATGPKAKAERLLRWMHTVSLGGGYLATQSSLAVLLDEHTFNCVSATTLFTLLGHELGLDVRTLEVPTHVFSILYTDHAPCDVETTTPLGVDPLSNPAVVRRLLAEQKLVYVSARSPELRREVGDVGLVALIYYNRGVLGNQEGKFAEALKAYFCCLSLDPEFPQAVQNALATLNNWSLALIEEKNYPEAVRVITAAMDLVPQDVGFADTRRLVYTRWAEESLERGQTEAALAVLQEAAKADPGGDFERRQAWVYIQPASRLAQQRQWPQALALAAAGSQRVSLAARLELEDWRQGTYADWMRAALDARDFAAAAQAMEDQLREGPEKTEPAQNLAYVVQTWAIDLYQKQGRPAAEALLGRYRRQFPGEAMTQAAAGYVGAVLESLRARSGYAQAALAMVSECEPLLGAAPGVSDLLQGLFDQAAQEQLRRQAFAEALDIYRRAQVRFPQDAHWLKGEDEVRNVWIRALADKQQWEPALALADQAAGHTSDEGFFAQALATLAQAYAENERRIRGPAQGMALLTGLEERFPRNSYLPAVAARYAAKYALPGAPAPVEAGPQGKSADAFDARGQAALARREWAAAAAIYDEALKLYPQHARLLNNAAAAWDRGAEEALDQKKWDNGLAACEQALARSLRPDHFEKKIVYLVQTAGREYLSAEDVAPAGVWLARQRRRFPRAKILPALINSLYVRALADLPLDRTAEYQARGTRLLQSWQKAQDASTADTDMVKNWCDRLAQDRLDRQDWKTALDQLAAARRFLPRDEHLHSNEIAVWNLWAQSFIRASQWELAAGIFKEALKRFPEESLFVNNLKYCQLRAGKRVSP